MNPLLHVTLLSAVTLSACAAQQAPPSPPAPETPPAAVAAQPTAPSEPAHPAAPPVSRPSNTWYANRIVRVSYGDDQDTFDAAAQRLRDTKVFDEILAKYGLPQEVGRFISMKTEDHERRADLTITVDLSGAPQGTSRVARELADEFVARLKQFLQSETQEPAQENIEAIQKQRADATAKYEQTRAQLAAIRQQLRAQTGRSDASVDGIRDELSKMEDARQEMQVELDAKAARAQALSQNIAKLTGQVEEKVKNDPVAAELEKVVEARQKQAERIKTLAGQGQANAAELDAAIAEVADARAKLLDRRASAADAAGGDTVSSWNKELMALSVDTAELQARLEKLAARADRYRQVMDQLDQFENLTAARDSLQESLDQLRDRLRELQHEQRATRAPRSLVVHCEDRSGDIPPNARAGQ